VKMITNPRICRYFARAVIFLAMLTFIVGMPGFHGVGSALSFPPSQNSPSQNLEIRNWYDLDAVRNNLAGNHTLMNDLDSTTPGYWELASPIANQWKGWQPIGFVEVIYFDDPFGCSGGKIENWYGLNGTFDGQGYEIRNLFINHRPDENDVGLFGAVDEGGIIKDIGAVNVTVAGWNYVGGLAGRNRGIVSNSYSSGNVDGYHSVGGLVGWNQGTVSNSYSSGNVTGEQWGVGGLVGINGGNVTDSFWDMETSGQSTSDGGAGKTTAEMKNVDTFSDAGWNIITVADSDTRNTAYIWNIVNGQTYPFLSCESVS
jgi:hypothetical protein